MLGLSSTEVLIILIFAFLLFGPDKLPQIGRTLGRAIRQFNETREKMTNVVQTEVIDPMTATINESKKPATSVADDDEDADSETESTISAHKETFAERRARLAAEKAAQDQAKAAEAAETSESVKDAATQEEGASQATISATSAESVPAQKATTGKSSQKEQKDEKPVLTTADLYARRPRKSTAVKEANTEVASDVEVQKGGDQ